MTFRVAEFPISDENLQTFRRWVKKPKDCVINALELINIIDHSHADLMRIVVGDIGVTGEQILDIFKYVTLERKRNYEWRFVRYTVIESLADIANNMKPKHVIFCGYTKNGFRHVFMIGKDSQCNILYIDPQINVMCSLKDDLSCLNHIANAQEYFVLQIQR